MAVWTQTHASEIEDDIRIDAEYYHPENKLLAQELDLLHTVPLGSFAFITDGQHGYFKLDPNSEIRQITAKHIEGGLINKDDADHLSIETHIKNLRSSLCEKDILITTAGTIGRIGFVTKDIPPANIDQDLARIAIRNGSINALFLWVYLQTRFGQFQIKRFTTGQVQQHLSLAKTRKLKVPDVEWQQDIVELAESSIKKRFHAKNTYLQAQSLLESELGLDKLTFDKPVSYSSPYSACLSEGRIDADYFQPKYLQIRSLIESYPGGYDCLLSYCDVLAPNFDPRKHPKETFNYIELANIEASIGLVEGFTEDLGLNLPSRAKRMVAHGDVIASSVVGSVEKSALITDEDGYLASTGFFHFRPKNISSEFLLVLIRSVFVRMQLQQQATGGILSAVPEQRLCHIVVPRIPKALQDEITLLVRQAHKARKESKRLLGQAKHRVEALIKEAIAV